MDEHLISHDFEEKIKHAFHAPTMRSAFVQQMQTTISEKATEINKNQRKSFHRKKSWSLALYLAGILMIIILAVGPRNVIASVQKWFGFVPGFGILEQGTPIRILSEVGIDTRNEIRLTISEGYFTDEKSILIYSVENVPYSVLSHDENVVGCSEFPYLILPDGTRLTTTGSWGNGMKAHITLPPVPENVDEVAFVLPCVLNSLPGLAPENWELPIKIIPAPVDLIAIPVIEVNDPATSVTDPLPTIAESPQTESLFGIQMKIDQAIQLADGYYLIGHNEWKDERITKSWPSGFALKAVDANGISIPIEPAHWQDIGIQEPQESQWFYKLYGRGFKPPLTIFAVVMTIDFQPAITFEVNPDAFGFDPATAVPGTTYELEPIEIELLGYEARIVQADYMVQGISRGFDFGIKADPALQSIPFILTSPVIGGMGAGGGGSSFNESKGLVSSIVLRDGSMQYPLQIQVNSVNIKGNWSIEWDAPSETSQTLVVLNECFTYSDWKKMLENPQVIPSDIGGKILFSRSAFTPEPSEFSSNLDGTQEQSLVFGRSSLSPDGTQLVYSNLKGQIVILNLENNTETILYDKTDAFQPIWSPDGKSIAFTEFNETTQILVMDTDGNNLREIIKSNLYPDLLGWTADNKQLMYRNQLGERRGPLILLDIDSKEEIELFDIISRASMSPNGQWIAYIDSVPGKMGSGLYVSKSDQSEKRLLVQLDYLAISNVTWSPDGKWLGFSVFDHSTFIPTSAVGIINLESCQVYPIQIPGIEILREWRNP